MYDDFLYERLIKLRTNKGVSQREMSLSMGQSEGYMTKIESRTSLPSMTVFFNICDYFRIHPKDFFDDGIKHPDIICDINGDLSKLNKEQLQLIASILKDMTRYRA
jgi:transcriptional regulator with XRE-family HTH domain